MKKHIVDAFLNSKIKIPFFEPSISNSDRKVVSDSLRNVLLTDGPKVRQFESNFKEFTSAKHAIGVSNATSALHLSLKSLGIGKGDEVIVPDMTFVATTSAVMLTGATPIIADVNQDDLNISLDSIEKNITKKTKAILPVHFAGMPCNMKGIMKLVTSFDLSVIEDCAHAIGAFYKNRHVGTFGDVGCFSFYPTKNITTLEGGMVITNSNKVSEYIKTARNHGITKSLLQRFSNGFPWDYDVNEPGYNYRLDEIRSSLGINQLKRITKLNSKRRQAFTYYNKKLENISGIISPNDSDDGIHAYHLYIIKVTKKYGISRDNLFRKLLKQGIRTTVHYKPLHKFSVIKKSARHYDTLANSEKIYDEILSLPFYPTITRKQQDYVVDCIANNN